MTRAMDTPFFERPDGTPSSIEPHTARCSEPPARRSIRRRDPGRGGPARRGTRRRPKSLAQTQETSHPGAPWWVQSLEDLVLEASAQVMG